MPLGEGPITSYFPRLGKGKGNQPTRNAKRNHKKMTTSVAEPGDLAANAVARTDPTAEYPGPSKKRLRRSIPCSFSSASSGSLPPAYDIFAQKSKKARSDGIDKTCSVISLEDDSDDGKHPKNEAGPSCNVSDGRCLGRLSLDSVKGKGTLNVEQWLDQQEYPTFRPSATRDSVSPTSNMRLKLPGGTAKRLPCSDTLHGSSLFSTHWDTMSIQDRSREETETVVLSSQAFERQEEHSHIPDSTGEGGVTEVGPDHTDAFMGILEGKFPSRSHRQDGDHRDFDDSKLEIINSSQTQDILLNYVSPRRRRVLKYTRILDPVPLPSLAEGLRETIVQSSQSQSEVGISQLSPRFGLDRQLPESVSPRSSFINAPKPSSYREREGPKSQPTLRTYSDELFSIPRRDDNFAESLAQDPPLRNIGLNSLDKTTAESNGHSVQEDSETESDTDNEIVDPCTTKDKPQQEQRDAISNEVSDRLSEYSPDNNYTPLPGVVEEFHAMFGSDESYPPDFPSSLRLSMV